MRKRDVQNQPSELLLKGRRSLEYLAFYHMISDFEWFPLVGKWGLHFSIEAVPQGLIPETTEWYILIDPSYPWGSIDIYPAKDRGITHTFYHQSSNGLSSPLVPWRNGKICVQTSLRQFGRRMYDTEPFTTEDRLLWNVSRAREWLDAAGKGVLVEAGDPFEFPDFPGSNHQEEIAFIENHDSFAFWNGQSRMHGTAEMIHPYNNDRVLAIIAFKDEKGTDLHRTEYGSAFLTSALSERTMGIWIRLNAIPFIAPWQAPTKFGELRSVMANQGVSIDQIIRSHAKGLRDGKPHPLLVGFAVPRKIGESPSQFHWQGLLLPPLSHGTPRGGYRPNEESYNLRDTSVVLTDSLRLEWMRSRNWHAQEIGVRGHLPDSVCTKRILVLGAGAVGSVLTELLIRAGCHNLVLMDGDKLEVGNLCRHTLDLQNLAKAKASELAARLNKLTPQGAVIPIDNAFPHFDQKHTEEVMGCDVVIDCTGDDLLLHQLSVYPWNSQKLFISVSVSIGAKRLYFFAASEDFFPHERFMESIRPFIERDLKENQHLILYQEGIGCWHPVFPARADDIWLMASVAVKEIEDFTASFPAAQRTAIFEQVFDGAQFQGIRRIPCP